VLFILRSYMLVLCDIAMRQELNKRRGSTAINLLHGVVQMQLQV